MANNPRPVPVPPRAIPDTVDKALREQERKRVGKLDPLEIHRPRTSEMTGQPLLGHVRSTRGPEPDACGDLDEADQFEPPDHPTRDSE